jgi:predicted CoA-binding protein
MTTFHEAFWKHQRFAVVGHRARMPFPKLTYGGLKSLGKKVFAVDPSGGSVEGDPTYAELGALPEPVEAAVLEVPSEETSSWVQKVADAGIRELWIHMGTDTPEALRLAAERGIKPRTGTCAVMYVTPGFSMHAPHRWIMKLLGKY